MEESKLLQGSLYHRHGDAKSWVNDDLVITGSDHWVTDIEK